MASMYSADGKDCYFEIERQIVIQIRGTISFSHKTFRITYTHAYAHTCEYTVLS